MKKLCLAILFLSGVFYANAQDLIVLKNGSMIEAKVMEISPTEIRYKRFNHQDGPTIVIPANDVLSIRYANGMTEIIGGSTTGGTSGGSAAPAAPVTPTAPISPIAPVIPVIPTVPGLIPGNAPIPDIPSSLHEILNKLPAIPIAGNNLKFEFVGETWTARVNGENFSAGTITFDMTGDGATLTLKQTHIWPGAVGKTAGRLASRIPGGAAVGGALNAAGNVAGQVGPIETSGTEIILEYKEGPPASLRLLSTKSADKDTDKKPREMIPNRLHTVGVSLGSSFVDPAFIATIHGTFSPVRNMFLELGVDFGFVSVYEDVESYFTIYPFARVGLFLPFTRVVRVDNVYKTKSSGGWYIGAGAGYMGGSYDFAYSRDKIPVSVFAFDAVTGFNFGNVVDFSYSIRTDFGSISHKLSVGYVYRFK